MDTLYILDIIHIGDTLPVKEIALIEKMKKGEGRVKFLIWIANPNIRSRL